MSFASEPGRDDGNLPPVNIVIPDDARDLDRDVLAYRREQRARRRRQRVMRLFGPLGRREHGGHAAILPLIATCVALSLLAGAMLSVITISPASAPTLIPLPGGNVTLGDGSTVPVNTLTSSAIALVPTSCDVECGQALGQLAGQAAKMPVRLYFAASGAARPQLAGLTKQYGAGKAQVLYDTNDVLGAAYHPQGLTVLLVHSDGAADVQMNLRPGLQLGHKLSELTLPGS